MGELNNAKIKNAAPREKAYQMGDRDGLVLDVRPSGMKVWRVRAALNGRRTWITIGDYPYLSLADARQRAAAIKQKIRDGLPVRDEPTPDRTFRAIAEQWLTEHCRTLKSPRDPARLRGRLQNHVYPFIGDHQIDKVTPSMILPALRRLADMGEYETMARTRAIIGQIYRYANANDITQIDPTRALAGSIPTPPRSHLATLTDPADVAALMRAIDSYREPLVRALLLFSAYTFVRPGEARRAEWREIDTERAEWRIPAEKMKRQRIHIVPLSRQALEAIETARGMKRSESWVFPSPRGDKPLSDMAATAALRALGYGGDRMTAHGFRGMASTILHENGFRDEWIERQLAHADANKVRAAYNYAEYLDERRKMCQWYADYLDSLRDGESR